MAPDPLREALEALTTAVEAYREAQARRGHETPHDRALHGAYGHTSTSTIACLSRECCGACAGARYGTEAEVEVALIAARAALATVVAS